MISIAISKFHTLHDKNKYFGKFKFYEIVKIYKVAMGEFKQVLVAGINYKKKKKSYDYCMPINYLSNLVYFFCNYIFANENGEPCGQQELVSCSKQLKALSETSEFNFIINKEELERLCP